MFSKLYEDLKRSYQECDIIELLIDYFSCADDNDKIRALYFFIGGKIKRAVQISELKELALEIVGIPEWLFDESYRTVGDLTETISLILPAKEKDSDESLSYWIDYIEKIKNSDDINKKEKITEAWKSLDQLEKYIFNKLITGSFRAGINEKILIKALSEYLRIETNEITQRVKSNWHPDKIFFEELFSRENIYDEILKPYPIVPEEVLETSPEDLGVAGDWHAEWKYKGIRSQLIYRKGQFCIWTEDEELVTDKFPELESLKNIIPDGTVLEGVIMCYDKGKPMPLIHLQNRLRRKKISKKMITENPVAFIINDILETVGKDIRSISLNERADVITNFKLQITNNELIKFSEELKFENWNELRKLREKSGELRAEGILLRRKDSDHLTDGNDKIQIWKSEPFYIDAVLMYAMKGDRTDHFSEYTVGVWNEGILVSIAKVKSELTDNVIREVDEFIKNNTLERFGPVRTVKPELVFEIAFESISESKRHKSGYVLHSPMLKRWRKDKKTEEADSMVSLKKLLITYY